MKYHFSLFSIMNSFTLSFSGCDSTLDTQFFPPIELDSQCDYECGLINFQTFQSIPNVDYEMNKIYIGGKEITIPTGAYEIDALNKYAQTQLNKGVSFSLIGNKNTFHSEIKSSLPIDFTKRNTIAPILGFQSKILEPNLLHISDKPVDILRVKIIRIQCDIVHGSYFNGVKTNTIHAFFPSVEAGYKIVETPKNVIYFPLTRSIIDSASLRFIDQNNNPINFCGENITAQIHIRKAVR